MHLTYGAQIVNYWYWDMFVVLGRSIFPLKNLFVYSLTTLIDCSIVKDTDLVVLA